MNANWWKWGDPKLSKSLSEYPRLKSFLENRWDTALLPDFEPPSEFKSSIITGQKSIGQIFAQLQEDAISFTVGDRLQHAAGKSYHDLIRIFKSERINLPDFVLYPKNHEEVQYILKRAQRHNIIIQPFGGGTNVTGAFTLHPHDLQTAQTEKKSFGRLHQSQAHEQNVAFGQAQPYRQLSSRHIGSALGGNAKPRGLYHGTLSAIL